MQDANSQLRKTTERKIVRVVVFVISLTMIFFIISGLYYYQIPFFYIRIPGTPFGLDLPIIWFLTIAIIYALLEQRYVIIPFFIIICACAMVKVWPCGTSGLFGYFKLIRNCRWSDLANPLLTKLVPSIFFYILSYQFCFKTLKKYDVIKNTARDQ